MALIRGVHFSLSQPVSEFTFYEWGKIGLSKSSIISLAESLDLPMLQMAELHNLYYKTISRKKGNELMDSWVSAHAIEIAAVAAKGFSVFESDTKFNRWLRKPNTALHFQTPLSLLKSPTGIRLVGQVLGRIEEGIYS